MEETDCEIICGAPTTLAVKGLMMMMMMMMMMMGFPAFSEQALATLLQSYQHSHIRAAVYQ